MNTQIDNPMRDFINTIIENHGGVYTYSEIATSDLKNAVIIGYADMIYSPKFMYLEDENGIVMKPEIENVIVELRKRVSYSPVRLINFFTKKQVWPDIEEEINLIEMFKRDMTLDQQCYLDMLLNNAGTNNLL